MKAEIIKNDFNQTLNKNEIRVYREKDHIVNDKRLSDQFDYYEVLNGKGLDRIIDQLVKK